MVVLNWIVPIYLIVSKMNSSIQIVIQVAIQADQSIQVITKECELLGKVKYCHRV